MADERESKILFNIMMEGLDEAQTGFERINENFQEFLKNAAAANDAQSESVNAAREAQAAQDAQSESRAVGVEAEKSWTSAAEESSQAAQDAADATSNATDAANAQTEAHKTQAEAAREAADAERELGAAEEEETTAATSKVNIASPYAAGRGLGAAGTLARRAGATELGGALQTGGELFTTLNFITRMQAALDKANVSMEAVGNASILVAASFAAIAIVFSEMQREMEPLNQALDIAVQQFDKFTKISTSSQTLADVQLAAAKSADDLAGSTKALAVEQDKLNQTTKGPQNENITESAVNALGSMTGGAALLFRDPINNALEAIAGKVEGVLVPSVGKLNDTVDKNKAAVDAQTAAMNANNDAQKQATILANTAADQARKSGAEHIQQAQQFYNDDQQSAKADQARVEALYNLQAAQQEAINGIEATNKSTSLSAEQHLKNQQAIDAYRHTMDLEGEEITHLTSISIQYADAREKQAAADEQFLKQIDDGISQATRRAEDEKLTAAANDQKVKSLQIERDATDAAIKSLEAHGVATDADQKKLEELTAKLQDFDTEIQDLNKDLLPAKMKEIADAQAKTIDQENTALVKFNNEQTAIDQKGQDERTQLEANYQKKLADIQTKSQEAAVDDQTKLLRKEQDDSQKYNNSVLDEQTRLFEQERDQTTKYNETVQKDQLDHQRKLADMREQEQDNEQDAIANRDFQALSKMRQKETEQEANEQTRYDRQLTDAATAYDNERALDQTHYSDAISRLQTAMEREDQAAQQAYQRELDDLNTKNTREKQAAYQAEQDSLTQLTNKIANEHNVRQQGYNNEIIALEQHMKDVQEAILNVGVPAQTAQQVIPIAPTAPATPNPYSATQDFSGLVQGAVNAIGQGVLQLFGG